MLSEEEIKKTPPTGELPKEERDKHRALLAGVIFFMILIIFLWSLNAKNVFKSAAIGQKKSFDVDKFSQEFQKSFAEVGVKMSELKEISPELLNDFSATTTAAEIKK